MKKMGTHVYAIVRVELDVDTQEWSNRIKVKEIVRTEQEAQKEVDRLTLINGGKGCLYFAQSTRLVGFAETAKNQSEDSRSEDVTS
jgi:hypothetical protein